MLHPLTDYDLDRTAATSKTQSPPRRSTLRVLGVVAGLVLTTPLMLRFYGPRLTRDVVLISLAVMIPLLWWARNGLSAKSTLR
jgi:hypothetical protein